MPTVAVNGVTVYYRKQGAGQGVILLHSSSSASGQWRHLMDRLAERYLVLAPDLHGYGRTGPWPAGRPSLFADEVAIVTALLDVAEGPVHLVGHSYGGAIAVRAALVHEDRLASLTLIEPTLFHLLEEAGEREAHREIRGVADAVIERVGAGDREGAARGFLAYWVGPGAFDAMPPERRDLVIGTMEKLCQEWPFAFVSGELTQADLGRIRPPTLVVRAERTTLAARRVVDILRRALRDHEAAEIAGAGHMSPVTHPADVNPVIEAHILRHSAAP